MSDEYHALLAVVWGGWSPVFPKFLLHASGWLTGPPVYFKDKADAILEVKGFTPLPQSPSTEQLLEIQRAAVEITLRRRGNEMPVWHGHAQRLSMDFEPTLVWVQ